MSFVKLFLAIFSIIFIVLATPANAAEISGDISLVCPFGKPFFIGPMDPGKSFELLPGHTKIERAKIESHRKMLLQCLSQYGKNVKFTFVGMMDPLNYRGARPEVHNGLNGGVVIMRATGGAKIARGGGWEKIKTKEMYGEEGQRGLLVIPDLDLCTAEDINGATRIVDEITGQILQKGQCKAILGQQLPAGRITKVKISLVGDETFDGSGKNIGLPTTKTCYVVVGTPVVVRKDPPVKPADPVPPSVVAKVPVKEICTNGKDDNGDGLIDCQDPECFANASKCGEENTLERCTDEFDNDGDSLVDKDDKDCDDVLRPVDDSGEKSVVPKKTGPSTMDKIKARTGIEFTVAGMFFVPNEEALGGVGGLKTSDGINFQAMFNLNIKLVKGFSLVPGFGGSSFTSAFESPNTDEDILTKDVRHWELRAQLVLLKQIAENLEIGLGFGANFNQADELWFVQGVLRYSLDKNWFIQGGAELFFFKHPLDGSDVRVWAPFFGIGFRW